MKKLSILVAGLMGTAPVMAELTTDAYGSIRMQAESVSVDKPAVAGEDGHTGIRDAFSRVGVKADYALDNGWNFGAKLEIPFNVKEMKAEDPTYFQSDVTGPRVAKVTASKDGLGSVAVGMQWTTFYNYVAYPVDYFSSFYSGWATHASFRADAVTYYAPTFNNVSIVASALDLDSASSDLETQEYAISYSKDGISAAFGYRAADEGSDDFPRDLMGASASYTTGPWRFATKVETVEGLTGEEDATIYNIYGSYNLDKYTFKAMYANGDDVTNGGAWFKGDTYHLGADYQYTDNLMVFAEYFYEEKGYALYTDVNSADSNTWDTYGNEGSAIAIGARYDF